MTIATGELLDFYIEAEREWQDARRAERYAARQADGTASTADWWASSLGKCYRVQVAKRLGVPAYRELDAQALRTFKWGDAIETFVRKLHYRLGLVKGTQVYLADDDLKLSNRLDLVVGGPPQDPDPELAAGWSDDWNAFLEDLQHRLLTRYGQELAEGGDWVKEIKSAKSFKMQLLARENEPDFNWKMQVGAGMLLTERDPSPLLAVGADVNNLTWVVEAIGRDAVGVLTFEAEPEWQHEAEHRVQYLNQQYARIMALPEEARWEALVDVECECSGSWQCEYCDYSVGIIARDAEDNRLTQWTVTFGCCLGGGTHTRAMRAQERRPSELRRQRLRVEAERAGRQTARRASSRGGR